MNIEYLHDMIKNNSRYNEWIILNEYHIELYYRISLRCIDKNIIHTFDIANINVSCRYRRKGFFKKFLECMMKICEEEKITIYVESILNPYLYNYLISIGFKVYNNGSEQSDPQSCYYSY